ncbi:hypothetical protein NMY22_g14488 [Coprinellus aureogranulatus]|nr:hypothetical protein NMY22_g14488 [Coprinellus aureogranulatus]
MIDVLHALPELKCFHFLPDVISPSEVDSFVYPDLTCLRNIALRCQCLVELAIPVDLDTAPISSPFLASGVQFGVSKLRSIFLYPGGEGLPSPTIENITLLAKFLYHLCPDIETTTRAWVEGSPEHAFWKEVYVVISSFKLTHDMDTRSVSVKGDA